MIRDRKLAQLIYNNNRRGRWIAGLIVIRNRTFDKIIEVISTLNNQKRANETIKMLRAVYYDNMQIKDINVDVSVKVARKHFKDAFIYIVGGEHFNRLDEILKAKKINLKTLSYSGYILREIEKIPGVSIEQWCEGNSIIYV